MTAGRGLGRTRALKEPKTRRAGFGASRWLLIPFVLLPALRGRSESIDVRTANGRLTVRADEAPLTEVLDRVAAQTGTKIVYQGPRPSPLVTVAVENVPEPEALSRILEGLGLNHVIQMDASGTRVEMLIVDEAFGSGSSTASSRGQPPMSGYRRPMPAPPPESAPEVEEPFEETPPEDAFDGGELSAPGGLPAAVSTETPAGLPSASPTPGVSPPGFPSDASTPLSPMHVPYPVFPGGASQP